MKNIPKDSRVEEKTKMKEFDIDDQYTEETVFTNEMISAFAQVSGDSNPLHTDKDYAVQKGFNSNIVHGMLSASVFSRVLGTKFPGNGSIYVAQDIKFLKPIYADEKVKIQLKILLISNSKYTISTQIYKNSGLAVDGIAKIIKN